MHSLEKEQIYATSTLLRMIFFAVRNNCSVLGKWLTWAEAVLIQRRRQSPPPPREILVCLLKLFYVALSWRQIRPHERAIMPPLVAAALRISASLLTRLGSPGGRDVMRTSASCMEVPECRRSDFELEILGETMNASHRLRRRFHAVEQQDAPTSRSSV